MSIKILTKSGEEVTAIDDARAYNFDSGNKSGIVKGALNEGKLFAVASNVIAIDSCELRIYGHRIIIDTAESITMANRPSTATRYSIIAEVVVSDSSVPSFRLFIQPANVELIQQNLYKTLNGKGTYQLKIGNFTLGTDGNISDIVRVVDIISGGGSGAVADIEFNVTTKVIASGLKPEVNVDYNEDTKKYDMEFALPEGSGTNVTVGGVVQKNFDADSKVDKVEGKELSSNDYTNEDKSKLASLSKVTVDDELSTTSTNPVQNKVINSALSTISQNVNLLSGQKANSDATNLTDLNIVAWQQKLGILDIAHPIGSYYISANSTSPASLFGGTWDVKPNIEVPSGNVSVKGNGMTLGLTNGSSNIGVGRPSGSNMQVNTSYYGKDVTTDGSTSGSNVLGAFGVTTDATKSGIIADLSTATKTILYVWQRTA